MKRQTLFNSFLDPIPEPLQIFDLLLEGFFGLVDGPAEGAEHLFWTKAGDSLKRIENGIDIFVLPQIFHLGLDIEISGKKPSFIRFIEADMVIRMSGSGNHAKREFTGLNPGIQLTRLRRIGTSPKDTPVQGNPSRGSFEIRRCLWMCQWKDTKLLLYPKIIPCMILVVMGIDNDLRTEGVEESQKSISTMDKPRINQQLIDTKSMDFEKGKAKQPARHFDGSNRTLFVETD
jgi:hypothetical protein